MTLERLRSETRAEHEATESDMPLMDDALTMKQYVHVLQRLDRIVTSWEQWAHEHAPVDLIAGVQQRQHATLLRRDLRWAHGADEDEELEFAPGKTCRSRGWQVHPPDQGYRWCDSLLGARQRSRHGPVHAAKALRAFFSTKGDLGNGLGLYHQNNESLHLLMEAIATF